MAKFGNKSVNEKTALVNLARGKNRKRYEHGGGDRKHLNRNGSVPGDRRSRAISRETVPVVIGIRRLLQWCSPVC